MRPGVSVVIPVLNEAVMINSVLEYALSDPATAEVIVIDDSSIDDTAELAKTAGAQVMTSSMLGKGASMQDGAFAANFDIVVFLDGDLSGLQEHTISDMIAPLLNGSADFVKEKFGRGGGRVTELTAKPMLKVFFPEIAHFAQPLGGIIAVKTSLLKQLNFESGYGVDIGLLIDAFRKGARICEVDIGSLEHDSQPQKVCVIGSASNDLSMLLLADNSYALDPNTDAFVGHARIELVQSLDEVAQRFAE
jgi:glycosyltransferase involved in cell wall biosynthesis